MDIRLKIADMENMVARAVAFAIENHGDQKYGPFPYAYHLASVEAVLRRFHVTDDYLLAAAWLHDILEDTRVHYSDLAKQFPIGVCDIVYAVTDELGKNKRERHEKTYPKIKSLTDAIIIKLADRIANVEMAVRTNDKSRYESAKKDMPLFKTIYKDVLNYEVVKMSQYLESLFE